jgi:hypothetical protein
MSISFGGTSKRLDLILRKRSKAAMDRHADYMVRHIKGVASNWRRAVKSLLSVKYTGGRNISPFPYKRTGDLIRSLTEVRVRVRPGKQGNERQVSVYPLWKTDPHGDGSGNYGEILNKRRSAPYGGWKDRTYDMLIDRVMERVR